MNTDQRKVDHIKRMYVSIYKDILQSKNLELHLKDVEQAVMEIDNLIKSTMRTGRSTAALEDIKNNLYYLIYEIKERL